MLKRSLVILPSGNTILGNEEGERELVYLNALADLLQEKYSFEVVFFNYPQRRGGGSSSVYFIDKSRLILEDLLEDLRFNENGSISLLGISVGAEVALQYLMKSEGNVVVNFISIGNFIAGSVHIKSCCYQISLVFGADDLVEILYGDHQRSLLPVDYGQVCLKNISALYPVISSKVVVLPDRDHTLLPSDGRGNTDDTVMILSNLVLN